MKNIKKLLFISVFLGILIIPNISSAVTVADLQAQINALLAQVQQLQTQLAQMQGGTTQWCHDFNTNLAIGSSGSEVEDLRTALEKEGFNVFAAGPEVSVSEVRYFGEKTASAVSGFQQKYKDEILAPWNLQYGTGFVGKTTRAKLNKLYGCGVIPAPILPQPTPMPTPTPMPSPSPTVNIKVGESDKYGRSLFVDWTSTNASYCRGAGIGWTGSNYGIWGSVNLPASGTEFFTFSNNPGFVGTISFFVQCFSADGIKSAYDTENITITPTVSPSITVLSPNGGESWQAGDYKTITWKGDSTTFKAYKVELINYPEIIQNGAVSTGGWQILGRTTSNSFNWKVGSSYCDDHGCSAPSPGKYKILVRAQRVSDPDFSLDSSNILDVSDAAFSIVAAGTPSITVLSPNGGEKWEIGKSYTIQWKSVLSQPETSYGIELFYRPEVDPALAGERLIMAMDYKSSYQWTIPSNILPISSNLYRIIVHLTDRKGNIIASDQSDTPFSIVAAGTIACTDTDNGKDYYKRGTGTGLYGSSAGKGHIIGEGDGNKYTYRYDSSLNYSIYYDHCHDSSTSKQLNEGYCDANGILQAEGYSCPYGCQTGACLPKTPSITVLSPNGGERWTKGQTNTIKWYDTGYDSVGNLEIILLECTLSPCAEIGIIAYHTPGTQAGETVFNWDTKTLLPLPSGGLGQIVDIGKYHILIRSTKIKISDFSDAAFSIAASGTNLPDLVVSSFSATSSSIPVNQKVRVTLTIKNIGNIPATSVDWTYTNQADGFSYYVSNSCGGITLNVGATCQTVLDFTFPTPGSKSLSVLIDQNNTVAESNETNNTGGLILNVTSPEIPTTSYIKGKLYGAAVIKENPTTGSIFYCAGPMPSDGTSYGGALNSPISCGSDNIPRCASGFRRVMMGTLPVNSTELQKMFTCESMEGQTAISYIKGKLYGAAVIKESTVSGIYYCAGPKPSDGTSYAGALNDPIYCGSDNIPRCKPGFRRVMMGTLSVSSTEMEKMFTCESMEGYVTTSYTKGEVFGAAVIKENPTTGSIFYCAGPMPSDGTSYGGALNSPISCGSDNIPRCASGFRRVMMGTLPVNSTELQKMFTCENMTGSALGLQKPATFSQSASVLESAKNILNQLLEALKNL